MVFNEFEIWSNYVFIKICLKYFCDMKYMEDYMMYLFLCMWSNVVDFDSLFFILVRVFRDIIFGIVELKCYIELKFIKDFSICFILWLCCGLFFMEWIYMNWELCLIYLGVKIMLFVLNKIRVWYKGYRVVMGGVEIVDCCICIMY